jgi:hypothetical protein
MSKHQSGLQSIERQLRVHDLRLARLRAWLEAVIAALRACGEHKGGRCEKALDATPSSETLEYERDTLEREIRAHEVLTALGRDRPALALLEAVAGDPALAREAAGDPRAFAEARGVKLPRNMDVRVDVVAERVSVRLDYIDRACAASLTFP